MLPFRRKKRVSPVISQIEHLEQRTVLTAPSITSGAAFSIPENQVAVETATATDPESPPETLTFSISGGADAALFTIDPATGALAFLSAPNFEAPLDLGADNTYEVEITVDDGNLGTDAQSIAVTITGVNESPVFVTPATFDVAENTNGVGMIMATDPDLPEQSVNYTITGGVDSSLFNINPDTGALVFLSSPNFELPLDAGGVNLYHVDVTASDGVGGVTVQHIAVTVAPANEFAPAFTSPAEFSVTEGTTAAGNVVATDADLPAETISYAITGGADSSLFHINPATGALAFLSAPNFDLPLDAGGVNVYHVSITADDGLGLSTVQNIAVTVTEDTNTAPVFTSSPDYLVANGQPAVATIVATDSDLPAQTVTYSIGAGADAALFGIDPATGALAFLTAPDFNTPQDAGANNVYNLDVVADDGAGLTAVQHIVITVLNDSAAPVFTSPAVFNIAENTTAVGTIVAADADLPVQTVTYSISGGVDGTLFTINSATGELTFLAAPNFETPLDAGADNVYDIKVTADDGAGLTAVQSIAVTVTATNDNSPLFTSPNAYNIAEGTIAVGTVAATDADLPAQAVMYSITGGVDSALFTIDPATGALAFLAAPNFEVPLDAGADNIYNIEVTANDGVGQTTIQSIAVTVEAVSDEAPVFTSSAAFNVLENTTAVGMVVATDADLPPQTITYSITGGVDAALFTVNPTTGALTFVNAPDFETPLDVGGNNEYNVQVTANDGTGSITAQDLIVTVTNADEAPIVTLDPTPGVYQIGEDRDFLDPTATFEASSETPDFSSSQLIAAITANANQQDTLSIFKKGNGIDEIKVKGKKVVFGGVVIGTASGGRRGQSLVVTLNSSATTEAVSQLVKSIDFQTHGSKRVAQATRTLSVQLTNVSGENSNLATRSIDVVHA